MEGTKKLIIIPAYNESKNLDNVIDNIKRYAPQYDYVIINDCSTDNTKEMCREKSYNCINLPINLGIGGGVQTGYLYAYSHGYDIAVQIDGDGQHDAAYLKCLYECMQESGADMVIGSRFITGIGFQSSRARRMGINILSRLINIVCHKKITDPTSGFRMINRNIIQEFCKYYPKDYPEPESIANILRLGYKIEEVPVQMRERKIGKSSINVAKSIYYMIKVGLAILIDSTKSRRKTSYGD